MPADGIICLDNGIYKIWFARNYRCREPNTVLLDNALATMGAGLPSAMAAEMVYPDRKVMAICGDGGFMMNSQEMETAVRLGLNLTVLVLRDDAYGMISWKQANMGFADFGLDLRQSRLREVRRELRRERASRRERGASSCPMLAAMPRHAGRAPDRLPDRLLRQRPHPEQRDQAAVRKALTPVPSPSGRRWRAAPDEGSATGDVA